MVLVAFFACVLEQFVGLEALSALLLASLQVVGRIVLYPVAQLQQVVKVEAQFPLILDVVSPLAKPRRISTTLLAGWRVFSKAVPVYIV